MAERTTSQLVGATLIGGMVGAGLAILLAPRSGKETREHIHDSMNDMKSGAKAKMDKAKSKMHASIEDAKDLKHRLSEAAQSTGRKAKSEMEELKDETAKKRRQSPVLSAWEEEV